MSRVDRKVYMFGGYDGAKCFNDIEILDLHLMTWIQPNIYGKIPMARNAHTMTVIGTKLYLFGGHSGNKHLKDLHIFDTETLTWTEPQVLGIFYSRKRNRMRTDRIERTYGELGGEQDLSIRRLRRSWKVI